MTIQKRIHLLSGILLISFFGLVNSQSYSFETISNNKGLGYTWVNDITGDHEGYVWFCTVNSIYRYNGVRCEEFLTDQLHGLRINDFIQDKQLNYWIATDQGLLHHLVQQDSTVHLKIDQSDNSLSEPMVIYQLYEESDTSLLIGASGGLYRIELKTNRVSLLTGSYKQINEVNELEVDADGNFWIVNNKTELWYIDNQQNSADRIDIHNNAAEIYCIYYTVNDELWVASHGNGVLCYDKEKGIIITLTESNGLSSNVVRAITCDQQENIWFGSELGITIYSPDTREFNYTKHNPYDESSLADNAVYCLYPDDTDQIWVGTFFNGVSLYTPDNNQFRVYQPSKGNYGIGGRAIGPILSNDSLVYIGTEDNGLSILNLKDQTFRVYNQSNSNIAFNNIHSLLIDSKGYLWIGTFTGGLSKTLLNKGYPAEFKTYKSNAQMDGLTNNNIYHLKEDADGNLLIGTHGGGINKYIRKTETFERIGPEELSEEIVWGFVIDDSFIWITTETNLYKLDKNDYTVLDNIETGVTNIITLFKTSTGKLLIGTENKGIVIYNDNDKSLTRYTSKDILTDNTAYSFIEDRGGYWFSSNRGIHYASATFDRIESYTVDDGFPTNRFNYNSAAKIDNWLYFGSTNGLVVYNKNYREQEKPLPKLNLTSIHILGQADQPYESNINTIETIKLQPRQRNFTIHFVAINFSEPDKIEYAYQLENFDKEWRMNGRIRQVSYSNLTPGNYTFNVCTVKDGEFQENLRKLNIRILPFWWETLVFKLFLILSMVLTVSYIIWLVFKNNAAKHQVEIERIEKNSLKEIQSSRLQFFTNVSHEFKTPLNLITGPIEYLTSDKQISNVKRKSYYNLIQKNADRLLLLINELIEFRKVESEQLRLNFESVKLRNYMSELLENFNWLSESKKVRLLFNTQHNDAEIILDTTKFEKVVFNLVSNAFNFTKENGFIEIDHCIEEDYHVFNFRNTGGAVLEQDVPFLFDRFYSSGNENSKYSGSGIGLNYVKLLLELHKGSIELQSFPDIETSFIVKIPVDLKNSDSPHQNSELGIAHEDFEFVNEQLELKHYRPKIIVVEDSKELREFLHDYLNDSFEVRSAADGIEALKIIKDFDPEVVISDIRMPRMNGYELCNKLKNDYFTSHIMMILLTANEEEGKEIIAYKSGADLYLNKPFSLELLTQRIWNLIIRNHSLKLKYQTSNDLTPEELTNSNPDELFLRNILALLDENLHDSDLDINFFVQKMGVSRSSIYRKMKAVTGQSINEFIQNVRLKKATELLIKSTLNISEIAYETGFNDPYYFSRIFKKFHKMSPSEYRVSKQNDSVPIS